MRIIEIVDIIFSINFWDVPALSLELPVTNSGPTITSILCSLYSDKGVFLLHVIHAVGILFSLQSLSPPTTYGVVPEAAIPITKSFDVILFDFRSSQA